MKQPHSKRCNVARRRTSAQGHHPPLAGEPPQPSTPPREPDRQEENEQIGREQEDLQFISSALLSGKLLAPTPFEEIEADCPEVWRRALQVFGGNKFVARNWLETRSADFGGQRPYTVARQVGGQREVLRRLTRMSRSAGSAKRRLRTGMRGKNQQPNENTD